MVILKLKQNIKYGVQRVRHGLFSINWGIIVSQHSEYKYVMVTFNSNLSGLGRNPNINTSLNYCSVSGNSTIREIGLKESNCMVIWVNACKVMLINDLPRWIN